MTMTGLPISPTATSSGSQIASTTGTNTISTVIVTLNGGNPGIAAAPTSIQAGPGGTKIAPTSGKGINAAAGRNIDVAVLFSIVTSGMLGLILVFWC
jgi:hypothetical protein